MSKTAIVSTKQHVRSSFRDAVYTSLNIGMNESYFCAFMIALGVSEVVAGLGIVLPQFIGVLFQLLSIRSFFRRYSLKNRLLIFLFFQALALVPLFLVGLFRINHAFLVISILGFYWACLLSLNPPWNRLIGHTVPVKFRLKFFSIRSQFAQFSVFLGLITSGFLLHWAQRQKLEMKVFISIFAVGFILKSLSWYEVKANHKDYDLAPGSEEHVPFMNFFKRIRYTEQGKLIVFLFFFYIAVYFSAPYFNPYMLAQLKFNYLELMGVASISYFGRVFAFRFFQRKAKSRHIHKLLIFSALGITTSPMWWAISQNFWFIILIEFLSGCYWAGFELSTILLYFQKIDDRERTSVMTYITFLNTSGMLIGSLLGAWFMTHLPPEYHQYLVLFAASSCIRLIVILCAPHVNFKGQIPKLISFNRVFSVMAPFGSLTRPFIGRVRRKKPEEEKKQNF